MLRPAPLAMQWVGTGIKSKQPNTTQNIVIVRAQAVSCARTGRKTMKLGIEGDSPDSISQYYSINTDNP